MRIIIIFFFFILSSHSPAQSILSEKNKGKLYFFWGWNRAFFSNSTINFQGENYNFLLKDVEALDRQNKIALDPYLNPLRITIPQTNFRIGYFISNHYDISIGVDHMKYVMKQNQKVQIVGNINNTEYPQLSGVLDTSVILTEDFLTFEHTDGLNYINIGFTRNDVFFNFFENRLKVSSIIGLEAGLLYPKTNTKIMNKLRYDEFKISGYGMSGKVGINFLIYKYFFIQSELKSGFINMPWIRTSNNSVDRASQHFFYLQPNMVFGLRFL